MGIMSHERRIKELENGQRVLIPTGETCQYLKDISIQDFARMIINYLDLMYVMPDRVGKLIKKGGDTLAKKAKPKVANKQGGKKC